MDYSPTGVYAINAGNGTYVVPEYWVPRFADVLSKSTCWSPFVTGDIDGARSSFRQAISLLHQQGRSGEAEQLRQEAGAMVKLEG